MKNKDFNNIDKLAQDAFEHFEVPLGAGDWMDFQQKLDAESNIDEVAKNALAGYEVPLDPNGWDNFEQLQQRNKQGVLYIWWFKAAEVSIMALLLLVTIFHLPCPKKLLPTNTLAYDSTPTLKESSITNNAIGKNQVVKSLTTASANLTTSNAQEEEKANSTNPALLLNEGVVEASIVPTTKQTSATANIPATVLTQENSSEETAALTTAAATAVATPNSNKTTTTNLNNEVPTALPTATANNAITTSQANTDNKKSQQTTNTTTIINKQNVDNSSIITSTIPNNASTTGTTALLAPIFAIQSQDLQLTKPSNGKKTIEPITTMAKIELAASHTCRHYFGAILGVGANMRTSMGPSSIGYSGGLNYEKEFSSKISISTGLTASYKRYDRTDILLLDRSRDGQVYEMLQDKSSNLVVVEIPVDIHYTCFRSDKWRLFAAAGLSANAIFSRTYTGSQEVEINGLTISTDLNSNDFERGLAEGGKAQQNLYLSLGGGFGVERKLGDKISLYLMPTYRHGINTVNGDLIHTFHVNIGIKKAL